MKNFLFIFMMLFSSLALAQNVNNLKIGSGDAIEIFVDGSPELSLQGQVSLDGSVNIPLLGKVKVDGKTSTQVENEIERMLRAGGFLRKPNVSVTLLLSARNQVTILGKVNAPGKYPIGPNLKNIFDLLALSGGVDPMSKVVIVREKNKQFSRKEVDIEELLMKGSSDDLMDPDLKLKRDDIVYVKEAPVFYTFGETGNTMLPLKEGLLLQQAIVMAGGFTPIADEDAIKIKREVTKGNYKEIDAKLDTIIQENDIIIVDESLF